MMAWNEMSETPEPGTWAVLVYGDMSGALVAEWRAGGDGLGWYEFHGDERSRNEDYDSWLPIRTKLVDPPEQIM